MILFVESLAMVPQCKTAMVRLQSCLAICRLATRIGAAEPYRARGVSAFCRQFGEARYYFRVFDSAASRRAVPLRNAAKRPACFGAFAGMPTSGYHATPDAEQ
jgi:hypothetical protein